MCVFVFIDVCVSLCLKMFMYMRQCHVYMCACLHVCAFILIFTCSAVVGAHAHPTPHHLCHCHHCCLTCCHLHCSPHPLLSSLSCRACIESKETECTLIRTMCMLSAKVYFLIYSSALSKTLAQCKHTHNTRTCPALGLPASRRPRSFAWLCWLECLPP